VSIDNVIPGAWVYIRQTPPKLMSPEYPIGKAKAIGTSVIVQVYPVLQADAFVTAYQEVGGKLSGAAPWVQVEHKAEFPPPKVVPPSSLAIGSSGLRRLYPVRTSGSSIAEFRSAAGAYPIRKARSASGGRFRTARS
jgi:hypothetical protein